MKWNETFKWNSPNIIISRCTCVPSHSGWKTLMKSILQTAVPKLTLHWNNFTKENIVRWVTDGFFLVITFFIGQFLKKSWFAAWAIASWWFPAQMWPPTHGGIVVMEIFGWHAENKDSTAQRRDYSVWAAGHEAARAGRPEPLWSVSMQMISL